MVVVLIMVFTNNYNRKRKAEAGSLIESAQNDFRRNNQYDSSYAANDTVRFYNDRSFVGMAAIASESENDTVFYYRHDSLIGMTVIPQR